MFTLKKLKTINSLTSKFLMLLIFIFLFWGTALAVDSDGDGIDDAVDNCPTVPNADQLDTDMVILWDNEIPSFVLSPDGVGNVCDNCPGVPNADQLDTDMVSSCSENVCSSYLSPDGVGDVCDNCPTVPNADQLDGDFIIRGGMGEIPWIVPSPDGVGDACDNCRDVPNPDQEDNDAVTDCDQNGCSTYLSPDGVGDACDNCPDVPNAEQNNSDADDTGDECDQCPNDPLKIDPGVCGCGAPDTDSDYDGLVDCLDNCPNDRHKIDPGVCGCGAPDTDTDTDGFADCIDNCDIDANHDQSDINNDGIGDACDCGDGFMGTNEDGADCGGHCPEYYCYNKWPLYCFPVMYSGDTNGKIDIVFLMAQDYNANWGQFQADMRNIIFNSFYADPIISANRNKINFWYVPLTTVATVNITYDGKCSWSVSPTALSICPFQSIGAILHVNPCRDYSSSGTFSSEPTSLGTFLHESGHGVFGLADEYNDAPACRTTYFQPSPHPNIFQNQNDCQSVSQNPGNCSQQFTTCQGGWWKGQPLGTMMNCRCVSYPNNICTFGPDGEPQVNWVFSQYSDPPVDETRKAVITTLHYDGDSVQMISSTVVYGDSPERVLEWDGLSLILLNSSGEVINRFSIEDPRYIDYDYPPGGELLNEADFTLVFPFMENVKTLEVYKGKSGPLLNVIDLSASIRDFCLDHQDDPQCLSYDSDNDGRSDMNDNCPDDYNPDQLDRDGDGKGNVCDEMKVPVDIKPQSCPNPLNIKSKGVLPVAILGMSGYDITEINPQSIRLEGVAPIRHATEDVATPFVPFVGKGTANDCTFAGPDGIMDLTLKFNTTDIVSALVAVTNKEVRVLHLRGKLYDGTPIMGEDVVILKK
jgi:hypothetical protein